MAAAGGIRGWIGVLATMVRRELSQTLRDGQSIGFVLVGPVVVGILASYAMATPHVHSSTIGVVAPPAAAAAFTSAAPFDGGGVAVRVVPTEAAAAKLVRTGDLAAAVVVPPDVRRPVRVISNRAQQIAEGIARDAALLAAAARNGTAAPGVVGAGVQNERISHTLTGVELYGPGFGVFFLLLASGVVARTLHAERDSGTLARARSAGVTVRTLLFSKALTMVFLGLIEMTIVLCIMHFGFGAHFGNLAGVVVVTMSITLAVGALSLLIAVVTRTSQQAQSLEIGIAVFLGIVGGRLLPANQVPDFLRVFSNVTPNGIAMGAFTDLTSGDVGALTILRSVALILAFAVVLGAISLRLAQRMIRS